MQASAAALLQRAASMLVGGCASWPALDARGRDRGMDRQNFSWFFKGTGQCLRGRINNRNASSRAHLSVGSGALQNYRFPAGYNIIVRQCSVTMAASRTYPDPLSGSHYATMDSCSSTLAPPPSLSPPFPPPHTHPPISTHPHGDPTCAHTSALEMIWRGCSDAGMDAATAQK